MQKAIFASQSNRSVLLAVLVSRIQDLPVSLFFHYLFCASSYQTSLPFFHFSTSKKLIGRDVFVSAGGSHWKLPIQ